MRKRNPILYLSGTLIILLLVIFLPVGCAPAERPFQDNWVESVQEGKLTMAPGYDANWDGPPLRPVSHK